MTHNEDAHLLKETARTYQKNVENNNNRKILAKLRTASNFKSPEKDIIQYSMIKQLSNLHKTNAINFKRIKTTKKKTPMMVT